MRFSFRATLGSIGALLCLIAYQNCAQEDPMGKALYSATARLSSICPAKNKVQALKTMDTSLLDPPQEAKIQLDYNWVTRHALNRNAGASQNKTFSATGTDLVLPSGTELIVTLDLNCAFHTPGLISRSLTSDLREEPKGMVSRKTFVWQTPQEFSLSELQAQMTADDCVKIASQNGLATTSMIPTDPSYSAQTHLPAVRAESAWDTFFDSVKGIKQEVVVAVIDSGVKIDHEDLRDKLWINGKEIPNNFLDEDDDGAFVDDFNGYNFRDNIGSPIPFGASTDPQTSHGTHVSGLISATWNNALGGTGIMGRTGKIMALNVYGDQTALPASEKGARFSDIDNAIYYAINKGAHVINMSLGAEIQAPTTRAAIDWAVNQGLVVVMAAGNGGVDQIGDNFANIMTYPAAYSRDIIGAISVGSVDADTKQRSGFSNYGNGYVEISAPGNTTAGGTGLYSTTVTGYGNLMGTSMASPQVAGAAALAYGYLWTKRGMKPNPVEVEQILLGSAQKLDPLKNYFMSGNYLDLWGVSEAVKNASSTCP